MSKENSPFAKDGSLEALASEALAVGQQDCIHRFIIFENLQGGQLLHETAGSLDEGLGNAEVVIVANLLHGGIKIPVSKGCVKDTD